MNDNEPLIFDCMDLLAVVIVCVIDLLLCVAVLSLPVWIVCKIITLF